MGINASTECVVGDRDACDRAEKDVCDSAKRDGQHVAVVRMPGVRIAIVGSGDVGPTLISRRLISALFLTSAITQLDHLDQERQQLQELFDTERRCAEPVPIRIGNPFMFSLQCSCTEGVVDVWRGCRDPKCTFQGSDDYKHMKRLHGRTRSSICRAVLHVERPPSADHGPASTAFWSVAGRGCHYTSPGPGWFIVE